MTWSLKPNQVPPEGDWTLWELVDARGAGKTFAAAHECLRRVRNGERCLVLTPNRFSIGWLAEDMVAQLPLLDRATNVTRRFGSIRFRQGGTVDLMSSGTAIDHLQGRRFDTVWCEESGSWASSPRVLAIREYLDAGFWYKRRIVTDTPKTPREQAA